MPDLASLVPVPAPMVLSPAVRDLAVRFEHDLGAPEAARALGVAWPEELDRAVPKRRAEYVAGRYCAQSALRAAQPGWQGQIPSRERAPSWPAGFVGSITHTDRYAWAAVAPTSALRGLGIDSEVVPDEGGVNAIRSVATSPDDAPRADAVDEATHYALLFSAKESLFKCLHPLVGRMFWYEDAGIAFDHAERTFCAVLRIDLGGEHRRGAMLSGRYAIEGARVHTAVLLPRS